MGTTRMVFQFIAQGDDGVTRAVDKMSRAYENNTAAINRHNAGAATSTKAMDDSAKAADRNNSSLTRMSGTLTSTSRGFGAMATAAVALAPAALPAIGLITAGVVGLGGILAGAGSALGVFGITAKSQFTALSTGYKQIETLKNAAALAAPGSAAQANDYRKLALEQQKYTATFGPAAAGMNHLQDAWTAWKKATSGPTLSILAEGMNLLAAALPKLRPLFDTGAQAAQRFLDAIKGWVTGGGMDRAVALLNRMAQAVLPPLEKAMRNIAAAAGIVAPMFATFAAGVANGLARVTGAFAGWLANNGASAFQKFMAYITANGPAVFALLKSLAGAAVNIARSLAPLAPVSLAIAGALAQLIAAAPPWVIQAAAVAFVSYSLGVKAVAIWAPIATGATKAWAAAQWVLNFALNANPIGLIVLAVAALAGAVYLLIHYHQQAAGIFTTVWRGFLSIVQTVWGAIRPILTALWSAMGGGQVISAWRSVVAFFQQTMASIIAVFNGIKTYITTNFDTWWAANGAAIKAIWNAVWGAITQSVRAAWAVISPIIQAGWAVISGAFRVGTAVLQTVWRAAWTVISAVARTYWILIEAMFATAWSVITAAWRIAWALLQAVAKVFTAGITAVVKVAWDVLVGIFTVAINLLTGRWGAAWRALQTMCTQIMNAINGFIRSAMGTFQNTISTVLGVVVGFFRALGGRILGAVGNLGGLLLNQGRLLVTGLWNGIQAVWNNVIGWFKGLPSKILHALGIHSPPQWALDAGNHIMNGILQGLAGGGSIESFFMGKVSSVFNLVKDVGTSIWHALFGGGGGTPGAGVERWRNTVLQALNMLGMSPGLVNRVLYQMQTESGGNPNIWNTTDSNAAAGTPSGGLMQVIGPTFAAYHVAGTSNNLLNPLANIAAALNYARARYGPSLGALGSGHGYARGSWDVPVTGPATVHQGEMILPAELASAVRGAIGSGSGPQPDRIERLLKQLIAVTASQGPEFARALDGTARRARAY